MLPAAPAIAGQHPIIVQQQQVQHTSRVVVPTAHSSRVGAQLMQKAPSGLRCSHASFTMLKSRKRGESASGGSSSLAALAAPDGGDVDSAGITAVATPSSTAEEPANGSVSGSGHGGRTDEIEVLTRKVLDMEETVSLQRELLRKQQDALETLQQKLDISQPRPGLARSSSTMKLDSNGMMMMPSTSGAEATGGGVRPFDAQRRAGYGDRRYLGLYDARFHSTAWGATPRDFRILPRKIILVRHGESMGNVDHTAYTYVPDPQVPLSDLGYQQAISAGEQIKSLMQEDGLPYKMFFYYSPYLRSKQTYEGIASAFSPEQVCGAQEEVQIREQDFGNFQDTERKELEKAERLRFGRFFYRFPNGESGADVYDRMTIFEDHMIRDINAGRFSGDTSLVLVTHGLATRVFLMRWFHWTVEQFLKVYNPPNAQPIVLERITSEDESSPGGPASWLHTKGLYRLREDGKDHCRGITDDMLTVMSRRKNALLENLAGQQQE